MPICSSNRLLSIYQFEHVVENEIASRAVGEELEDLGVVHWSFFFVDLAYRQHEQVLLDLEVFRLIFFGPH